MHILTKQVAEGMDGADDECDPAWLERLLTMPEPPTPPSRKKRCAAPGGPLPDLFCDELMPCTDREEALVQYAFAALDAFRLPSARVDPPSGTGRLASTSSTTRGTGCRQPTKKHTSPVNAAQRLRPCFALLM